MTLRVADMPAVYRKWLDGVEPAWTVLEAERIDALLAEPPFDDGAIRLAIDLTDDEIACSPMLQNALVLVRAAEEADGLELTARGNLTRETVAAMRSAMDWPGLLFEDKWRAGKRLREGHVEELRLVRELAMMNGLLIRKKGRLRVGATGRRALKDRRERLQASFFRDCFWQVSLGLFGEPECGSWPQGLIGPALWSLATTGDRWQDTQTLMRLSVLPDEAVLRNPRHQEAPCPYGTQCEDGRDLGGLCLHRCDLQGRQAFEGCRARRRILIGVTGDRGQARTRGDA